MGGVELSDEDRRQIVNYLRKHPAERRPDDLVPNTGDDLDDA